MHDLYSVKFTGPVHPHLPILIASTLHSCCKRVESDTFVTIASKTTSTSFIQVLPAKPMTAQFHWNISSKVLGTSAPPMCILNFEFVSCFLPESLLSPPDACAEPFCPKTLVFNLDIIDGLVCFWASFKMKLPSLPLWLLASELLSPSKSKPAKGSAPFCSIPFAVPFSSLTAFFSFFFFLSSTTLTGTSFRLAAFQLSARILRRSA
mmetsp:Transcript_56346/g.91183  ORF Transcript_56346/g.91183 Transcript_56346/m.91183 type:complete len:207 (-) Transcript_56346:642-1262(-)